MSQQKKGDMVEVLHTATLAGYEPEIGRWLWAMEAVRRRTLDIVKDLDEQTLDWEGPDGCENAIGSLLYHVAIVEMSWLFLDILEQDLPPPVKTDFPHEMASKGRLTRVPHVPLAEHMGRLGRSRSILMEVFQSMSLDDWGRLRSPKDTDYEVTPAWAVFHLVEHEAGHAAQISALKARATRFFLGGSIEQGSAEIC